MSVCRVNGRRYELEQGDTIAALLARLEIAARYTLVERNGDPVQQEQYAEVCLADGDELVVARPVAGG
jgi:sulfur carrier protein